MKFVYFGNDFTLPAIHRLIMDGHELIGILSFECDNVFTFNKNCQALAQKNNIPFIVSPATANHLEDFLKKGAQVFLAAGYPHKIPPIDENKAKAINVHPTYLPKGRGFVPITKIILDNMDAAAGFTAHKMTQTFDAGDILLQRKFALSPAETVETYNAKIAMRAPNMLSELMANLPAFWKNAAPQDKKHATYLPAPKDQDRIWDWTKPVRDIDRIGRAYGRSGCLAQIENQLWAVFDYEFWEEKHSYKSGELVASLSREIIIAARDGFFCLKDFQQPDAP